MPARLLKRTEIPKAMLWLIGNRDKSYLDVEVLDYPTAEVWISEVSVLPTHLSLVLESLGHDPDSDAISRKNSSVDCLEAAEAKALASGVKEVYYVSSDSAVDEIAMKFLGYEEVKCYRKKL